MSTVARDVAVAIAGSVGATALLGFFSWASPALRSWMQAGFLVQGWWLVCIGIICALVGWCLHVLAVGKRQDVPAGLLPQGKASRPQREPARRVFTDHEMEIIRLLRAADDQWLTARGMARLAAKQPASVAEFDLAAQFLAQGGWLRNRHNALYGTSYQLSGYGLKLAIEQGLPIADGLLRARIQSMNSWDD